MYFKIMFRNTIRAAVCAAALWIGRFNPESITALGFLLGHDLLGKPDFAPDQVGGRFSGSCFYRESSGASSTCAV